MGLDKQRTKETAPFFKGQKSGLPIESYGIQEAEDITNLILKDGALAKVNGTYNFTDPNGNPTPGVTELVQGQGAVYSLHRFKKRVVMQVGSALAYQTNEDIENYSSFITLDSTLSPTRLVSTSWRDRLFLTNADVSKSIFDNGIAGQRSYADIGVDPAPSMGNLYNSDIPMTMGFQMTANSAVGTMARQQDYYYLITLYDEKTNSEGPGAGAIVGQNGLMDLSPNSIFGPRPLGIPGAASASDGTLMWVKLGFAAGVNQYGNPANGFGAYLRAAKIAVPRATHFLVYRAVRVGTNYNNGIGTFDDLRLPTPLYNSFQRVPNMNTSAASTAFFKQYYMPIDDFLAAGQDFVDNTAVPTPVSLAENNSPPLTKARALAAWNAASNYGRFNDGRMAEPAQGFDVTKSSCFTHMRVFRDQLFGIGAIDPGYKINNINLGVNDTTKGVGIVSDAKDVLHGSEVYQPDYFTYLWEVGRGDGQKSVGLGVLGDLALLIFKANSTYYLSGSSPANYVLRIMDTNKGCVSAQTIQETPSGVICLDGSGFVMFNKVGLGERVSKDIQDIIGQIDFSKSDTFYSCYDPKELRYYCAVVVPGGGGGPNVTLCLDLATMEWTKSSGLEGLSRVIDTKKDGSIMDILGPKSGSNLYRLDDPRQVLYMGTPIESSWTSGTLTFGDDQRKKKFQWLYLKARGNTDWNVDIEIIPDNDESRKQVIKNWSVTSSQSTWYSSDLATDGNLIWGGGAWAVDGPARRQSKVPIKCLGYKFQIRIINRDADPNRYGFALETVSAEAVMMGR